MPYYAIYNGKNGNEIVTTWKECKANTHKIKGSSMKRFENEGQAQEFLENPPEYATNAEVRNIQMSNAQVDAQKHSTYVIGVDVNDDIDPMECPVGNSGCKHDSNACGSYMGHETVNGYTQIMCSEQSDYLLGKEIVKQSCLAADEASAAFRKESGLRMSSQTYRELYEMILKENYQLHGFVERTHE